jgi:hypothetical protein
VLVSGDCDEVMPFEAFPAKREFQAFIEHPCIWHWFAQNLALDHRKCTHLAIGLDYHTLAQGAPHKWGVPADPLAQEHALASIAQQATAWKDRLPRAYCNFQFQMWSRFGDERKVALAQMNPSALYVEPSPTLRLVAWKTQATYAFVASPSGVGFDCHRTWEALVLGCIPIVKHSPLDPLYADLPVLIVDDWSEVTPERLKAIHDNPPERDGMEKLTLAYWVGLIRAQQQACWASTGELIGLHQPSSQLVHEPTMPSEDTAMIRRNQTCPCGSGKKYKHCHGRLP